MPTERMEEVEVVCPHCTTPGTMAYERKWGCLACGRLIGGVWQDNPQFLTAPVKPGSLTAARLRLADAAEADEMARLKYEVSGDGDAEWRAACDTRMAFLEAMNVVRALRTARGA